jgi:3-hydroxyisobutyrate dehydrogenase-like beta-hydroxyacid dehydrogenase
MEAVTIIGLGKMGTALAGALLRAGHHVTVWNRTPEKAAGLSGAVLAPSAAEAIKASALTIVCVSDYQATRAILTEPSVAAGLTGRTVVQLSTGTPRAARELASWVQAQKAAYLDGAILAWPRHIGGEDTLIYVSGPQATYDAHRTTLRALAGGLTYLGQEVGASEGMFAAILSYLAGRWIGICHGALICESEGLSPATLGDALAALSPALAWDSQHMGQVISTNSYTAPESTLDTTATDIGHLVSQAEDARISPEWPAFASQLFRRATLAGYGPQEHAALIKILRRPAEVVC